MNEDYIAKCKENMELSLINLDKKFGTVQAGRANPSSLDGISIDYYGTPTPIKQLATVSVPEARQLLIKPFDKSCLSNIEKAIFESNLGYTPNNDGETIRIVIPQLTEDRRKELSKEVKKRGEEAKVKVRNIRRDANDEIKKQGKAGEISEDEQKDIEAKIQKVTDKFIVDIDAKVDAKVKELMTV